MKNLKKLAIATILLITACSESKMPDPVNKGVNKIKEVITGNPLPENDVASVIKNHTYEDVLTLAENGNQKAKYILAIAYQDGIGVPKNLKLAETWALRGANQGNPSLQFLTGMLHWDRSQNPRDLLEFKRNIVLSYMWLSLSAAQGHEPGIKWLNKLENTMKTDPELIENAQKLAAEWRSCNDKSCWNNEPEVTW
ncbi:MAG: sel1 repeat family protein [Cyclobacteriaceae bacterium]|nr:sel1 repeat family protein [Cyclobacteriaceae bacterium]